MSALPTPGPWRVLPQGDSNQFVLVAPPGKHWVLAVQLNGEQTLERQEANLNLIKEAPALAEALWRAISMLKCVEMGEDDPLFKVKEVITRRAEDALNRAGVDAAYCMCMLE